MGGLGSRIGKAEKIVRLSVGYRERVGGKGLSIGLEREALSVNEKQWLNP